MPLISLDGNVNSEAEEMNSTEGDSEDDSEGDSEGDSKGPDNAMLYKMAAAGYELLDGYGALDALETSTKADPMAEKLEQQRRMHEIVKDHDHALDRYVYDRLPPRRMAAKVSSRDDEFLMSGGLGPCTAAGTSSNTDSSEILSNRGRSRKRKQRRARKSLDMTPLINSDGYIIHQRVRELQADAGNGSIIHQRVRGLQADAGASTSTGGSDGLLHTNGSSGIQKGMAIDPVVPASPTLQTKQAQRLDAGRSRPVRIPPPPRPTLTPKRIPKVTPTFPPFVPKQTEQAESPSPKSFTPVLAPTIPELLEKAKSPPSTRQPSPLPSPIIRKETPIPAPQPWKDLLPQPAYPRSASTASIPPATHKAKRVQR